MNALIPLRSPQVDASTDIVCLKQISKRFGSTHAVKNVSLTFRAGEVHALLGENGAGKSTIGKVIGGLVKPDTGTILVGGKEVRLRSIAEARGLGLVNVFQELSLVPDLTVAENICLGTEAPRHPLSLLRTKPEHERCLEIFARFGFDFDLKTRACDLSVADQQLIEVIKALARRPRVLVLDEPTAMLGVGEKQKLLSIIRAVRRDGVAVVFITHHVEEVVAVADTVSLLKDGELIDSFGVTEMTDTSFIVAKLVTRSRSKGGLKQAASIGKEVLAILDLPGFHAPRVNISVSAGQIVGLYGVVGSGCQRIGRAAVGLTDLRPATMKLAGQTYRPGNPAQAARAGTSYLPSGRAAHCVLPSRSTRENLMISQLDQVQRFGIVNDRDERNVTRALLSRFRTRYAHYNDPITSLSGGNQQKVMLARCLGRAGSLILLEDPTAGVDIGSKRDIHELIRERATAGGAIFLVSSDLFETIAISDVIYTIIDDKIVHKYDNPTLDDEAGIIVDVLGGADGS